MSELRSRYDRYHDPLQIYAEADAETRVVIEKELDHIAARDQRETRLNGRGLNYGVVITLVHDGMHLSDHDRAWGRWHPALCDHHHHRRPGACG